MRVQQETLTTVSVDCPGSRPPGVVLKIIGEGGVIKGAGGSCAGGSGFSLKPQL